MNAFYFGTYRQPGHELWAPGTFDPVRVPYYRAGSKPPPFVVASRRIPWGKTPDGTLNPKREIEGEALLHHKDGWTAIAFANRTDDTRPGSNSVFIFEGELTFDGAIEAARKHFPQVVERFNFEIRPVHRERQAVDRGPGR